MESNVLIEISAAFNDVTAKMHAMSLHAKALPYRRRGWNDLADVIENEEGKHIVRNGMADVLDWLK